MKQETDDYQQITDYLLGTLPDAEAERLDELSFTDAEFADRLKVAENDLVDAYARGELGAARLAQFERHYLATPLRRQKVEFARNFQVFAGRDAPAAEKSIAAATDAPTRGGIFSVFDFLFAPRPALQWGLAAAALLFLLGGGWLFVQNSQLRNETANAEQRRDELLRRERELQTQIETERTAKSENERQLAEMRTERERLEREIADGKERERIAEITRQKRAAEQQQIADAGNNAPAPPRPPSIVSFVLSPPLRGGGANLPTLNVPARTDSVAIKLQLDADDYTAYQVELKSLADNRVVRRTGRIKARNRALNVRFPAKSLQPQNYSLTVSGVTKTGAVEVVGDYPFKIVR